MASASHIQGVIHRVAVDLAAGMERKDVVTKYCAELRRSPRMVDDYIAKARPIVAQIVEAATKESTAAIVQGAVEGVKAGLKTKHERILILQNQVDSILADIASNQTYDYVLIRGEVKKVTKELSTMNKASLRRDIAAIQAEISKIEGDYAPTKVARTDPSGNAELQPAAIYLTMPEGMEILFPSNLE